ncbi:hypothetical protein SARC_08792 [Sphaeroforma arctica JP610]|uniref:Ribophorin II C-terminal domain-containing protein n=1 Tax=Sphaeroforma arctica JP610 TaxID=667725 RepID=A0A0L0FPQ0_9EUKA|nr:hypothetical protein SARC_08792 [Sphaeroforma arctica JP610]KNC78790.1 hypothetical protein SARC_08792 [Sphaeroforma arctica JP610]|eukprot:XP_014152692.1 hypothetical protein SARC_08792 [Sphaeroforma arctica JP610]
MTSPTVDRIKTVKTTKGDGKYTAAMDFSSKRGPKVEAGTYTIDVLVGGLMIEKPLTWTVGKADIASTFVRQSATGVHRLEPLEYTFTPGFEVPSSFMGTVFSAAVVAPAVILLGAWAGLGVNLKQFNPSLAALVFHSSLVAMYALFIWFWVELNMYTTIWYFLPIGVVMFLSGHRALSQLEMA